MLTGLSKSTRFVSFLLRLAHDRSRNSASSSSATTTTTDPDTQTPDATLLHQISKLAEQIRKGNEAKSGEGVSGGEGAEDGSDAGRVMRLMRAQMVGMASGQVPHSGANF